jgi:uracil-DNA glycosylase family 4
MKDKVWGVTAAEARLCNKCDLCQVEFEPHVFGSGNLDAKVMFVNDAPTKDDCTTQVCLSDQSKSGKVYNKILVAIGLSRGQVYACNTLVCPVPNNEEAAPYQLLKCKDWLFKQVNLVQPKLIVTLGRMAACSFVSDLKITRDHGKVHTTSLGIDLYSLYHPSYVGAYSPQNKRDEFKRDVYTLRQLIRERGLL